MRLRYLNKFFLILILPVLSVLGFIYFGQSLLTQNDSFTIKHIGVKGQLRAHTAENLQMLIKQQLNGNLLTLDIKELMQHIQAMPVIKHARIKRMGMNQLVIFVEEHSPVAIWNEQHLISDEAVIYQSETEPYKEILPVFQADAKDKVLLVEMHNKSSEVLEQFGLKVKTLKVVSNNIFKMNLSNQLEVVMNSEHYLDKLTIFSGIYDSQLRKLGKGIYADLRYPNGFSVQKI